MTPRAWMRASSPVVALALFSCGGGGGGGGGGSSQSTFTNDLPPGTVVHAGQVVEFGVASNHVRAAKVTLNLQNPPPGCVFTQTSNDVATVTGRVRWKVPALVGGTRRLTFRAANDNDPTDVHFTSVDVRVDGTSSDVALVTGDVTGDGLLDTVAAATLADFGGVVDSGAIYVWNGQAAPTGIPDATLVVPGAVAGDQLGAVASQAIQLADVTGDGILDVVVAATFADVGGRSNAGAIYVWKGGATLTGTPAPLATLTIPGAVNSDQLATGAGQGVELADVTGDGILDVVAAAEFADVSGVVDAGAIFVWKGGLPLAGSPAPLATLTIPGTVTSDQLGRTLDQGFQLVDVTDDGILDVVAGADLADVTAIADVGAVYVWSGGPTLTGTPAPLATLTIPTPTAGDQLGHVSGRGILLADVSGDGVPDFVVGAELADTGGIVDTGAVYVWLGGATLGGTPAPIATLKIIGAVTGDRLGLASGDGIQLADVTGDGILDVVVAAQFADFLGVADSGAVYVWLGGPTLNATPTPFATLAIPGAVANDELGFASGQGVELADVTGDGVIDVVAGAELADVGGVVDAGAIYVWKGGATLVAAPLPLATLAIPGAVALDRLDFGAGAAVQLADVTGDGVLDVIAGAELADVGGVVDAGAIYVWKGGATLSGTPLPLALLAIPGAIAGDQLGNAPVQGIQLADLTGDGILDLVAGATLADVGGVVDAGAIYVWKGGLTLSGVVAPLATLAVPGAASGDQLGDAGGQGILFADVTGDGFPDVVAGARFADVAAVVDTGAIYVFDGGAALLGAVGPLATLAVPGATTLDALGDSAGQGVTLADLDGDGVAEVLGSAPLADVGGVVDAGAIYVWQGGATLTGTPALLATFAVPGAVTGDQLGN